MPTVRVVISFGSVVTELSNTVVAIPSGAWQHLYKQGAYTPHFILTHLLGLEAQVFNTNLWIIVSEDQSLLSQFDENSWMVSYYESGRPSRAIFDEFSLLRMQEVNWLRALTLGSWNSTARHPWWGVHTYQWRVELQLDSSRQHLVGLDAFLTI